MIISIIMKQLLYHNWVKMRKIGFERKKRDVFNKDAPIRYSESVSAPIIFSGSGIGETRLIQIRCCAYTILYCCC